MGHWRKLDDNSVGKDRQGLRGVAGYTWVIPHKQGEGELFKKSRNNRKGTKMKVDIIFYDRKTQKETGKKEFGVLSAFFYARYVLKDKKIIEKLYSFIKYRISLWINGYSVSEGHCTVWTNDRRKG